MESEIKVKGKEPPLHDLETRNGSSPWIEQNEIRERERERKLKEEEGGWVGISLGGGYSLKSRGSEGNQLGIGINTSLIYTRYFLSTLTSIG